MKSLQMIFSENEKLKRQKMGKVVQMKLKSKSKPSEIITRCCAIYNLSELETKAVKNEFQEIMTGIDYRSTNMYINHSIFQLSDKAKAFNQSLNKACSAIMKLCIEKQIYQRQG